MRSPKRVRTVTCPKTPNTTPPRSARPSSKAASRNWKSKLSTCQVIDPATLDAEGRVVFGATVDLEDLENGQKVTYQIVGLDEADLKLNKVSVTSPIARALIGKYAGDVVEVQAPSGPREYEILEVRYI
jgi:transcription elongation factor GreA